MSSAFIDSVQDHSAGAPLGEHGGLDARRHTATQVGQALVSNIERVLRGRRPAVELAVCGVLSGGHVLVEDVPGSGKTTLAKAVARSIGGTFRRVQATADLLPSDITGSGVWDGERLAFVPGPMFAHVVLVDELNRTPPRTQSAFLEAMEEGAVTVDGVRHLLPTPFVLLATQNPMDQHGTYALPEGQLDRFTVCLHLGPLEAGAERQVVREQLERATVDALPPVTDPETLAAVTTEVRRTYVADPVLGYAVDLARATREDARVRHGASARAALSLVRCAQALATLRGHDHVGPDEVKALAYPVLAHRVTLADGRSGGQGGAAVVQQALERVPVPPRPVSTPGTAGPGRPQSRQAGTPHRGRADVRPSARALRAALLIVSGLAALAVITGDVWLLLLACLAVGALVVDALAPWPGGCLHVGVRLPSRARAGEVVPVVLSASNGGIRLSRASVVTIRSPLLEEVSVAVAALRPGERVEIQLTTHVLRRGQFTELEVATLKSGLLGLLTWSGVSRLSLGMRAAPGHAPPVDVDQPAGDSLTEGGRPVVRPSGVEIQGLRDWRPGDPSRHVHWRSTARRGRLVVTDRLDEVGSDLVIVLGAPAARPGQADPDWEQLIARLAATALATVSAGARVYLVAAIHGVPDLSTSTATAVLDWCAELPPADVVLPMGDESAAWERARRVLPNASQGILLRTPAAELRAAQP